MVLVGGDDAGEVDMVAVALIWGSRCSCGDGSVDLMALSAQRYCSLDNTVVVTAVFSELWVPDPHGWWPLTHLDKLFILLS